MPRRSPFLHYSLATALLVSAGATEFATGTETTSHTRFESKTKVAFDRVIGWSGQAIDWPRGLACAPDGTLYVVFGEPLYAHRQTTLVSAFDRDGSYHHQVFPAPGGIAAQRRPGWPHLERDDGAQIPVVWHALSRCVYPGAVFGNRAIPAVSREGALVFVSGADSGSTIKHSDQQGGRRLLIMQPDGSAPSDFRGPLVTEKPLGGFGRIALSPDDRYAYVTGLFESGKDGSGLCNVVWRVALDGSGAEVFIGEMFDSSDLDDPQGLATDRHGNLYVCDYGNNRIAVFSPEGKLVSEIPIAAPDTVHISRKTGAIYVMTLHPREKPITDGHYYVAAHNWRPDKILRFDAPGAKAPSAQLEGLFRGKLGGGAYFALDDSRDEAVLWICGTTYKGGPVYKAIDRGKTIKMLGTPIRDALPAGDQTLPFVGNVLVTPDAVLSRVPTFRTNTTPASLAFDPSNGAPLPPLVPKTAEGKPENYWRLVYGEMVAGRDGRLYVRGDNTLRRYESNGDAAPFAASGKHVLDDLHIDRHTNVASTYVTREGKIYAMRHKDKSQALDDDAVSLVIINAKGEIESEGSVTVQGAHIGGLVVDSKGAIYLGLQITEPGERIAAWVRESLPEDSAAHHPSAAYAQEGAIVRFPPAGGKVTLDEGGDYIGHRQRPARVTLSEGVKVIARGGLIPGKYGDVGLGCSCETTRFDIDEHDRLFVPDVHRFQVRVLDTEGRELTRFGSYGNMDDLGPEIRFGWPLAVRVWGDRAYVADLVNRRVVAVKIKP